jgi:hypothetical protein
MSKQTYPSVIRGSMTLAFWSRSLRQDGNCWLSIDDRPIPGLLGNLAGGLSFSLGEQLHAVPGNADKLS